MIDVEKLNALIEQWNAGSSTARNELVVYMQPYIEQFSALEFNNGRVIATPLKLFSVADIAQTVSVKLLEKQKYIHLTNVSDLLILLRKMVYSTLVDEARKLNRAGHGVGNRVKANECSELILSEDYNLSNEHTFLILDKVISDLESKAKDQAIAFSLHRLWGVEISDIILILNISESTFYRYLEFADAFIKNQMLDSINND